MWKKIFIGLGILLVIVVIGLAFLNNRNRTLSPPGTAEKSSNGLDVKITYSRPSVRDRVIFGTTASGAIQPYGEYWRLGANESTEITINRDATFAGNAVKAGTYRIYAIPGETSFEIRLNTELGVWGALKPDATKDILTFTVPVVKSALVEQYTISLVEADGGIDAVFEWSDVKFSFPIR